MGCGKTRVGRLLARRLEWAFVDFDEEITRRTGLPIPTIFSQHGEGHFREVENAVGKDLLREVRTVLSPGGGWPAKPGRMEGLPAGTLSVWLRVTAEEALSRAVKEGPTRPLLEVADPLQEARDLLAEREPFYRKAHIAIDSMGSEPEELVVQIEKVMNVRGRNPLRFLPPHE
jgi:shikimate kinase